MENSFFIHENAIVDNDVTIGSGTRVWAFSHILSGSIIGKNCNICDHVFIEGNRVGDNVTIKCGVQLWDGVTLEDNVFVGPNVTFTNNPFPRSRQWLKENYKTVVKKGVTIGANATILPDIVLGENCMIGAGSVVTSNVPPNAIVKGNPARIDGYISDRSAPGILPRVHPTRTCSIDGARLVELPVVEDVRGELLFGQFNDNLPFLPKRFFIVSSVPNHKVRGEHAHREIDQFLVCMHGSVHVVVDNGVQRCEIVLDDKKYGLYIPKMIWATQYKYSHDAMLLVLASDVYDADEYIRDYDEFLELKKQEKV
jgi:acetyltransferase-like isoleucine patch superfamily enzyme/dTDP-4-dehydrorhamnose 3,5-epimerase-like enzyme